VVYRDLSDTCIESTLSVEVLWVAVTSVCVGVGMRVFVHGCAATPLKLLTALAKHGVAARLKDVELIHIHTEGPGVCVQPEYEGISSVDVFVIVGYKAVYV